MYLPQGVKNADFQDRSGKMNQIITSKDNNNIKLYQKISSNKKYRSEFKMFPLEGLRLIKDAVSENAELHCVLVTESCMKKLSMHGEALDFLTEELKKKTLYISDELGEKLASTEGTQGIFAVCSALDNPSISDTIKSGGRYIILYRLQDPGNMGTVIRTADAMGVDAVIAVNCCDIFSPKTIRSTMGSLFRMKICTASSEDVFKRLRETGVTSYAAVIDSDAVSLTDCSFKDGGAVFIGNEGNGLPQDIAEECDHKLTICMHGNVNSLNAATAASIIMWELTK